MSLLRAVLWFLLVLAVITVAFYVTGSYELTDRLTALFLSAQSWLPVNLNFEYFLVVLAVASFLVVLVTVLACSFLVTRLSIRHQRKLGATAAAALEVAHIKAQHWRQYGELLSLGQLLTKRLDKRVIVQTIVEATSRVTSVAQANSIVSCWLLNLETETIRFERGLYCDESMLVQTEFQPTEPPFSRVISSQQTHVMPAGENGVVLIRPEKVPQLGSATGVLVVPLVIESSVLGVLTVFCHPDILKSYEEQKPFYDAVWGELALALAIAIQGEVAILDRLTGVHNREYFMKRLIQEVERANRYQLPLSVLMIDIDNFKLVNDTLGHPQGDAVLRIIAKLIRKAVRAIDLVGRYGGEEFIVLLPETGYGNEGTTSAAGAPLVADRIRKSIDDEFRGLQKPLDLTVSIGVVCRRFPEERNTDLRDLIRIADEQLYRAKTSGKNRVCVLTPEKPQEVS